MNRNSDLGLQFGPEFAVRVLDAADRMMARRRRHRWLAAASGVCAAIIMASVWADVFVAPEGPTRDSRSLFASAAPPKTFGQTAATPVEQNNSPDALSWFFPDAESLVRYDAEDAPDDGANSASGLFAEEQ